MEHTSMNTCVTVLYEARSSC